MSWTAIVILVLSPLLASGSVDADGSVGKRVDSFRLKDQLGTWHDLAELKNQKVVVVAFLGTECPLAKLYGVRLAEMDKQYREKGVAFLGINANQQDSITEIQHYAQKHGIEFPILKDANNAVADAFGAERTPEVFVLDGTRTIRYQGRIDDQYAVGISRRKANTNELQSAIDQLLAGKEVSPIYAQAPGCIIGRLRKPDESSPVTYSKDIAPIFRSRCESCHREGEIAPFTLGNYDEVVGWAETIAEVVRDQRMPPWHADPEHGIFRNDCRLSQDEKEKVFAWVKAGAPEGNPADLPPPAHFTVGWQIPTPDMVVTMPNPIHVQATGVMGYKHILVDPGFKEDKWVVAAECRPGARSVVHHIIAFVKPPGDHEDSNQSAFERASSRFLVATAPGAAPMILPQGTAKLIPAGSQIVFQMHYTPNGTEQWDQSSVGLVFADAKNVTKRVKTAFAGTFVFQIPPNEANFSIIGQRTMLYDTLLLQMMPHMHLRGKSFKYTAVYPNGDREVILDVPRYDFNWQNTYDLAEPKFLPAGTVLEAHAVFDNSPENPANPDPNRMVRFGEQTWEEMMIGFFEACPADQDLTKGGNSDMSRAEAFLDGLGGDGDPVGEDLRGLAKLALQGSPEFRNFSRAARSLMPQVDRICVAYLEGANLKMTYTENGSQVNSRYLPAGSTQSATGYELAKIADEGKPVVHSNLSDKSIKGFDLKLLRQEFKSSVHVPFVWQGRKAIVSFWSKDPSAFPDLALDIARMMAEELSGKAPKFNKAEIIK